MYLFSAPGLMTIAVIALLLFGPEKLPQMGRMLGRFMHEFKKAQDAVEATIRAEMYPSETKADVLAQASPAFSASASDEDDEEEDEE